VKSSAQLAKAGDSKSHSLQPTTSTAQLLGELLAKPAETELLQVN
jgi:hypothetical protein